jgi:hypothetical protein
VIAAAVARPTALPAPPQLVAPKLAAAPAPPPEDFEEDNPFAS